MKWTFEQIEGPAGQRKRLELDGWNAPFGRPRKEPVIKEVIKSRIQTTRYPGSDKQTRHAFGSNWDSTELKGRWMTKNLGFENLTANDMADLWTAFLKDERTIRVAWGPIISYTGYLVELELGRESEHEIAWKMKIEIDQRDDVAKRPLPRAFEPVENNLAAISNWLAFSKKLRARVDNDLSPDFFDSLNNLAALINTPAAIMARLAGRFDDLSKASISTLQHFRGAVSGMRTALLSIRDTVLDAGRDVQIVYGSPSVLRNTAVNDLAWANYQADLDVQTLELLDRLNELDRRAELAMKNEVTAFVLAKEGDTWESISTRATGGPDKAADIRSVNGIHYGEKPVPGESYLVM
jgi:hypothetical protein